jgi:hypothetical protein
MRVIMAAANCSHRTLPLHREFYFSEGTSAKRIFDVEIEKFRAEFFLKHFEKTNIMLEVLEVQLMKR